MALLLSFCLSTNQVKINEKALKLKEHNKTVFWAAQLLFNLYIALKFLAPRNI